MTIFDVDERFLQEKGFYFITIDVIEYFKQQLKNGKYIDNGFCGTFMVRQGHVCIDGIEFENGNKAYIYFLDSNDYSVKEEIVKWNGCENRKKVHVYRNKYSFDVNNFYDIVRSKRKILGVENICFDECVLMDIDALFRMLKNEKFSYDREIKCTIKYFTEKIKELELQIKIEHEKNAKLSNRNSEIIGENKILKDKIKKIEKSGNILNPKTKNLFKHLVSVTNELEKVINN